MIFRNGETKSGSDEVGGFQKSRGQRMKRVLFFRKVSQKSWKGVKHSVSGFFSIMHDDNGAVCRMTQQVVEAFFRRDPGVEIPAQHRPHDDMKSCGNRSDLGRFDPTVWWSEKR